MQSLILSILFLSLSTQAAMVAPKIRCDNTIYSESQIVSDVMLVRGLNVVMVKDAAYVINTAYEITLNKFTEAGIAELFGKKKDKWSSLLLIKKEQSRTKTNVSEPRKVMQKAVEELLNNVCK
jgi:hypothetical protein